MIITVRDSEKAETVEIAKRFVALGYTIYSTSGTAKFLNERGINTIYVRKLEEEGPNILDLILSHEIDIVIDIPKQGVARSKDGFIIRRNAIETGVNVLTSLDTAKALVSSLENKEQKIDVVDIAKL